MAQSAILLCPLGVNASNLISGHEHEQFHKGQSPETKRWLQVKGKLGDGEWYITISHPSNARMFIDDYKSNEDLDSEFRAIVADRQPIAIDFNCFEPARDMLVRFLRARGSAAQAFWLDTDYGWVVRGDRLLEQVTADPSWDWRVEPEVYKE